MHTEANKHRRIKAQRRSAQLMSRISILRDRIRKSEQHLPASAHQDEADHRLSQMRDQLRALLAQNSAKASMIEVRELSEVNPRWVSLAEAADRLSIDRGHLARRCRQSLAARKLAVRVAIQGTSGPARWFIDRSLNERLAETPSANPTTSD